MSVDFYNCGSCNEIHSDCEPMYYCSYCESKIFNCCYEEQVKKYGLVGPNDVNENGLNKADFYGDNALKRCDFCQD